jgi:hypothetical protein
MWSPPSSRFGRHRRITICLFRLSKYVNEYDCTNSSTLPNPKGGVRVVGWVHQVELALDNAEGQFLSWILGVVCIGTITSAKQLSHFVPIPAEWFLRRRCQLGQLHTFLVVFVREASLQNAYGRNQR